MPIFWGVSIINGCWILSKVFPASIEIIIWFFVFQFVNMCITLIDLLILKNPCIPEINPTWSWCMIILMCCWNPFAGILLRIFTYMFISNIVIFFFVCCLRLVWYQGDSGPVEWVWKCFFLCNFLKEFYKDGH